MSLSVPSYVIGFFSAFIYMLLCLLSLHFSVAISLGLCNLGLLIVDLVFFDISVTVNLSYWYFRISLLQPLWTSVARVVFYELSVSSNLSYWSIGSVSSNLSYLIIGFLCYCQHELLLQRWWSCNTGFKLDKENSIKKVKGKIPLRHIEEYGARPVFSMTEAHESVWWSGQHHARKHRSQA